MTDHLLTGIPFFAVLLTLGAYAVGVWIQKKLPFALFNPLLTATILVIAVLLLTGVDYDTYYRDTSWISALLGPTIVALAIPLDRQFRLLLEHKAAILAGVAAGVLSCLISVTLISLLLQVPRELMLSLLPQIRDHGHRHRHLRKVSVASRLLNLGLHCVHGHSGRCSGPAVVASVSHYRSDCPGPGHWHQRACDRNQQGHRDVRTNGGDQQPGHCSCRTSYRYSHSPAAPVAWLKGTRCCRIRLNVVYLVISRQYLFPLNNSGRLVPAVYPTPVILVKREILLIQN